MFREHENIINEMEVEYLINNTVLHIINIRKVLINKQYLFKIQGIYCAYN